MGWTCDCCVMPPKNHTGRALARLAPRTSGVQPWLVGLMGIQLPRLFGIRKSQLTDLQEILTKQWVLAEKVRYTMGIFLFVAQASKLGQTRHEIHILGE